jgi:hypothetical protein
MGSMLAILADFQPPVEAAVTPGAERDERQASSLKGGLDYGPPIITGTLSATVLVYTVSAATL